MSESITGERQLGSYRLIRRIAVGGMAEIFEARDPRQHSVVLKVLLPQHTDDAEFITMLRDEARLATTVDHPNLVRFHALDQDRGRWFLVMELVRGPTLAQLLRHAGGTEDRLPPVALALSIARELLLALQYLHDLSDADGRSLDVVHRDVTPGNVLICRSGRVKLGDFGIARHRLRQARTRTGVIKGTVQYISPEQLAGNEEVDRRADIYGVGLILFEMLVGRPLIHGGGEVDLLRLAAAPPRVAPSSLRQGLSPAVDRLLDPALARFVEERYPNAGSFLRALDETAQELGEADDPAAALRQWIQRVEPLTTSSEAEASVEPHAAPRATRPSATPQRARPQKNVRWPVAAIAALSIAALLGGLHLFRTRPEQPVRSLVDGAVTPAGDAAPPWGGSTPGTDLSAPARGADLALETTPLDSRVPAANSRSARRSRRGLTTVSRPTSPRPSPPADAGPSTNNDPAAPSQRVGQLRARLERALAELRDRGILEQDLSAEVRARLQTLRTQLQRKDAAEAESALAALEPAMRGVQVDRPLVEAKLRRVHARLQGHRGQAAERLKEQQSLALQEFMDGRYESANRQLNRILRALK